jgi:hypothetical protein
LSALKGLKLCRAVLGERDDRPTPLVGIVSPNGPRAERIPKSGVLLRRVWQWLHTQAAPPVDNLIELTMIERVDRC